MVIQPPWTKTKRKIEIGQFHCTIVGYSATREYWTVSYRIFTSVAKFLNNNRTWSNVVHFGKCFKDEESCLKALRKAKHPLD